MHVFLDNSLLVLTQKKFSASHTLYKKKEQQGCKKNDLHLFSYYNLFVYSWKNKLVLFLTLHLDRICNCEQKCVTLEKEHFSCNSCSESRES